MHPKMLLSPFKKADGSICRTIVHNATNEMEILVTEPQSDHEKCVLVQLKSIDLHSVFEVTIVQMDNMNQVVQEIGERCKQLTLEWHMSDSKDKPHVCH